MVSTESPALSLSQATDLSVRRRRGLELFCLSFVALFLELMVIRWEPAVVRLIAYYANLILISSFLGLGVGWPIQARFGLSGEVQNLPNSVIPTGADHRVV